MKIFPIMIDYRIRDRLDEWRDAGHMVLVFGIPWNMIAAHEKNAIRNHNQTLERLAQRGGLSAAEAVAVIEGVPWGQISRDVIGSHLKLLQHVQGFIEIVR